MFAGIKFVDFTQNVHKICLEFIVKAAQVSLNQ